MYQDIPKYPENYDRGSYDPECPNCYGTGCSCGGIGLFCECAECNCKKKKES